jgi:hypothetical protein
MVRREAMTPTPDGVLSTSEIWVVKPDEEATEFAEAVLKLDDEKLVEVLEIKQEDDLPKL